MAIELEEEKKRAEALLCEVLPPTVASDMMKGLEVAPGEFPDVTVMFSDVPNFANIVPQTAPTDVVSLLNELFTRFDRLIAINNVCTK